MQRIASLLFVLSLASGAASAQSTMPAIGANTPKGQVARTDASINAAPADSSRKNRKNAKPAKKHVQKVKMTSKSSTM